MPIGRPRSRTQRYLVGATVFAVLVIGAVIPNGPGRRWMSHVEQTRSYEAIRCGRYALASRHCERASRWYADQDKILILRIRIARESDDREQFEEWVAKAEAQNILPMEIDRQRQLMAVQSGSASQKVASLSTHVGNTRNTAAEALGAYANGFLREGRLNLALDLANRWVAEQPEDPGGYLAQGKVYALLEDDDEAEICFVAALDRAPLSADAHRQLAQTLLARDAQKRALLHFQNADRLAPGDLDSLVSIASLQLRWGDRAAGESMLRKMMADTPRAFAPRYTLASHYAQREQPHRVLECLEPLIPLHQDDLSINYLLGRANHELGQPQTAEVHVKRYLHARHEMDRLEKRQLQMDDGPIPWKDQKEIALGFLKYRWDISSGPLQQAFMVNPKDPELVQALSLFQKKGNPE